MWRYDPTPNGSEMKNIIDELNSVGYYSSLFTIHSKASDYIPKIAYSFNPEHKIKYMIAFRPYLLSPQYFKMLIKSFDEIQPDRIIVNFVHGHIANYENFDGVMGVDGKNMFDPAVRKQYMHEFITRLERAHLYGGFKMPETLLSGGSSDAVRLASELGLHSANGYDSILSEERFSYYSGLEFEKIFVQVSLLIRDTDEEAEKARNTLVPEDIRNINIISGSEETVINKLLDLQKFGVTDILISNSFAGGKQEREIIHKFVSKQIKNGNLIGQQD